MKKSWRGVALLTAALVTSSMAQKPQSVEINNSGSGSVISGDYNKIITVSKMFSHKTRNIESVGLDEPLRLSERAQLYAVFRKDEAALIRPLLSQNERDVRNAILSLLRGYAQELEDINDGIEVDQSKQMRTEGYLQALSDQAPSDISNNVALGLRQLTIFAVERHTRKQLPKYVMALAPAIRSMCTLLERDIDLLQRQSNLNFATASDNQRAFIDQNEGNFSVAETVTQKRLMISIALDRSQADSAYNRLRANVTEFQITNQSIAARLQRASAVSPNAFDMLVDLSRKL